MNRPDPARVKLELEHDEQTSKVRIAVNDMPGRDVYGWLELVDRLERAAGGEPQPGGGRA